MNDILMALGPYVFYATAPSFEKLKVDTKARWMEQERLSRQPASQFIGPGLSTIEVTGTLYPDVFGSETMIDDMRLDAQAGTLFSVVGIMAGDLTGISYGQFYIETISDTRSFFGLNGAKKVEFTLGLKEYGADKSTGPGSLQG